MFYFRCAFLVFGFTHHCLTIWDKDTIFLQFSKRPEESPIPKSTKKVFDFYTEHFVYRRENEFSPTKNTFDFSSIFFAPATNLFSCAVPLVSFPYCS